MERKDLLEANAAIFSAQGKAMNAVAAEASRCLLWVTREYKCFDCHAQRTGYFRQPVHSNDSSGSQPCHHTDRAENGRCEYGRHQHDNLGQPLCDAVP